MSTTGSLAEDPTLHGDAALQGDAASHGEDETGAAPQLMDVLRLMAETQRELARSHGDGRVAKTRVLAAIKLPEFDGSLNTSVRRYREWRKKLDIGMEFNDLNDAEMALLLYTSLTNKPGRPKQLIEVMSTEDLEEPGALATIYKILDEAFGKMGTRTY